MATTFPIPQGFQPPDGVQPGQPFDAVASLKMDDGGSNLELVAVDGIPVGDGSDGDADDAKGSNPTASSAPPPQSQGGFMQAMK